MSAPRCIAAALALALLAAAPALAAQALAAQAPEERGLILSGKAWADAAMTGSWPEGGDADYGYLGDAALRLSLVNADRTRIRFDAVFEAVMYYGALAEPALSLQDALLASVAAGAGIAPDLLVALGATGETALMTFSVPRLSLRYDAEILSFALGRQIVNFGKGLLFSPADVFGKPSLSGTETSRSGVDGLRLTLPLGDFASLDAVAAPDRDIERGTYLARAAASFGRIDAALGGGYRAGSSEWLVTGEFLANVGIGLYAETALSLPAENGPEGGPRIRAQGGIQYSWDEWLLRGEYYFNGKSPDYGYADPAPSTDALASFPRPHNAFLMASWSPTDFLSLSAVLLQSLSDGASGESPGSAALVANYTAYPGCSLNLKTQLSWGDTVSASLGLGTAFKF